MKKIIKNFLKDVEHEIDMLKQHATELEKERLNFLSFNAMNFDTCIYGQLTGNCSSLRAKDLMDLSCTRVLHLSDEGVDEIDGVELTDEKFNINGPYHGQTWKSKGLKKRSYNYLSALEGYICTKNAKVENIIEYIKGKTEKLTL